MKYIRTKDNIFEVERDMGIFGTSKALVISDINGKIVVDVEEQNNIIKQANTIEELCDEFVYDFYETNRFCKKINNEWVDKSIELVALPPSRIATIKGAIWTDKGLIYVAKLNDKGDLKLI